MSNVSDAAREFLAHRRLAVVGVSREPNQAANLIYRTLRDRGYEVFAVNPAAEVAEGDRCYARLAEIPGGVDGVVVVTPPEASDAVADDCAELGIRRVWLHRSFGTGSVSDAAVETCRRHGITVIPGACPMMFLDGADFGHRCMRWILGVSGKLPSVTGAAA